MSAGPLAPEVKSPGTLPMGNVVARTAAIIEVMVVFAVVHISYRAFKHFTDLGRAEVASGLNFSAGSTMVIFTVALVLLFKRSFEFYGLSCKEWRFNLNLGLFWELFFLTVAIIIMKLLAVRFDPLHPSELKGTLVATGGQVLNTVLLLLFLMRERSFLRRIPPIVSLFILLGLLSLPVALASHFGHPVLNMLLSVLWLFFCAGFGEEIFFRGYIQSRVNQAFGCPYRFLGVDFGIGLFVSSLLFGFIHVLNTVDYFEGRYDFAWLWGLSNFATGLFFGLLCARKPKAFWLGGIMHGLPGRVGKSSCLASLTWRYHRIARKESVMLAEFLEILEEIIQIGKRLAAGKEGTQSSRSWSGLTANDHMLRVLVLSSTAAKRIWPSDSERAMPNAPPGVAVFVLSTCIWATNWPEWVNSTISLKWLGSVLTASPWVVIRSPLGASTSPSGPCK